MADEQPHDFVPRTGTSGVGSVAMSQAARGGVASSSAAGSAVQVGAQTVTGLDDRIRRKQAEGGGGQAPGAYHERKAASALRPGKYGGDGYSKGAYMPNKSKNISFAHSANRATAPGVVQMNKQDPSYAKMKMKNSQKSFFSKKKGQSINDLYNQYLDADVQLANPDLFEEESNSIWDEIDKKGLCVGLAIILVIITAIAVPVSMKKQAEYVEYQEMNRPIDNTWRYEPIATKLGNIWGDYTFSEPDSVQAKALDWIVFQDPRLVPPQADSLMQRYILAVLFLNNNGPKWLNRGHWMSHKDECAWQKVHCNEEKQVVSIELNSNLLNGKIPFELAWLSHLEKLDLHGNNLSGEIPEELYELKLLRSLSLDRNRLEGTLSTAIGNLQGLEQLDVSQNQLFGELPSEIGTLQGMDQLFIYSNRFKGSLFDKVSPLQNLKSLEVGDNRFTGTIPTEIALMTALDTLDLKSNIFSGVLPPELFQLKSLITLRVSFNEFEGPLPAEIDNLENLQVLIFEENRKIGGTIPNSFGNLTSLLRLDLGACGLTGTIPEALGNLTKVASLNLFNNYLTGTIPDAIGDMENLVVAIMHYNDLEGVVPPKLCSLREDKLQMLEVDCKREVDCPVNCCTRCAD